MGWRELTRTASSNSRKCLIQVPTTVNFAALPDHQLSPVRFPASFASTAKPLFEEFLRAFYLRNKNSAETAIAAGLEQSAPNSREALWFLIAKAVLRLDQGYIQSPSELDAVLDATESGEIVSKDEVQIIWALRGFYKNQELALCGLRTTDLDADQLKLKARFKDYLATIADLYTEFSKTNGAEAVNNEVQALFRIMYHRYIVKEFPNPSRKHALAQELTREEPKQYLKLCDDLLRQGRLDLFLFNIRFRSRSVAGVGPKAMQDRLQQCASLAKSKQHISLCRYLLVRNTDRVFEDVEDGIDRRYPEYQACSALFQQTGDVVDDASCQLLALALQPSAERLTKAKELRLRLESAGYPGLAFNCLVEIEIPLCLSANISRQIDLIEPLIERLFAAAKVETMLGSSRNMRLYDNLLDWMTVAMNVYTLTIIIDFTETIWQKLEPTQHQALSLSDRISSGHELITKTLYGRFPCKRLVDICYDSAWRFLAYARTWKDDHVISIAMSRMLYWQVAQASFCPTNREAIPKLSEVEELAHLGAEKDRDEVRYKEMIEKCCIITRAAMLHPARARNLEDVQHYRLARSLERRGGPAATALLDEVAEDWQLADHTMRDRPLSVEERAKRLPKQEYLAWKEKTKEDERFTSFAHTLDDVLKKYE